jgi:antitoxin MazE
MNAVVRTPLVKIGNALGVRIPKRWIDQLGLSEEVEMAVQPDRVVIRSPRRPRSGWERQFRAMAARGDDALLDAETRTEWDEREWEW